MDSINNLRNFDRFGLEIVCMKVSLQYMGSVAVNSVVSVVTCKYQQAWST